MQKLNIFISTFLLIFTTVFPFHIAPTFFEKRIDAGGGYQEFIMYNNSLKTQRFKVTALPGTGEFNGHMDKWIEYNPKIITIKPKSQSALKVYIKAPKGTPEGEYSTFLNFKSVPMPELKKDDGKTAAAAASIGLNINMEVVGYVGDLKPKLEIINLSVVENKDGQAVVSFKVKNNSIKRGVWYDVDIIHNDGNSESIEKGRIGVGQTDDITLTMKKMKKNDVTGVRLRDSSTYEDITKKEL
ncbi:hypothetical protein [Cetobacterium somerae]|uniref:Pili assembly chaperone N-terminal domain-containing protein n=1 Tax=Cetobacterium somerae ATCC BAA-474 TaxID=1319815 RepID=U7VEA9_9FUSO|nr:hypothetical protein [Cetobacterium somerae]ERT69855.1 hypothetical protein HMPREF0202_00217 [Cetobacterium somerae ATCC BAA-474]